MTTLRVRHIMERLTSSAGKRPDNTVDMLMEGDPEAAVTGIVTAFMPTQSVLEQAVRLGANLVIAHEGPYYSHHPSSERYLVHDSVYETKKKYIIEHGLALFRMHDGIHRWEPDGIMAGLLEALDWQLYVERHFPLYTVVGIPPASASEIAVYLKEKLGISYIRGAGNLAFQCRRIGLTVGYRGCRKQALPLYEKERLDLVIIGEGPEWETPEYVRDAAAQGKERALLVIGHAESEQAGMKWLANRIQALFPQVPVQFVTDEPIFRML